MSYILESNHLNIYYEETKAAVTDLTISLNYGEILSVVGGSGSGKSTFLHSAIGLLPDSAIIEGSLKFEGQELSAFSENEWNKIRGTQVALIFQNTGLSLNPNRRIYKQVWEYAYAHGKKDKGAIMSEIKTLMESVGFIQPERVLHSYPFQLSGGMLQRVAIALAMLLHPKLILADEPTSALDVTVQAQVAAQIKRLRDEYGTSIIFVTHNMGVASYMADRIAVMEKGRLVEIGSRNDVIKYPQAEYTKKLLAAVPELEEVSV
ncbi:MAG: ABC transporter ATP-binding protein [Oscillospiraceae bacterium]|nr:ABC transporter ATP-binding protein [Oscillospiraceae bacterium]